MSTADDRPLRQIPKRSPNPDVIKDIKDLADNAILTPEQIVELEKNVDTILNKTLPAKAASRAGKTGEVTAVVKLFKNDRRFRFLDQIPGARDRINRALKKHGVSLD